MSILRVKDLTKKFSARKGLFRRKKVEVVAVNGISFELNRGEILGFLGTNGAGKTTTIQMLLTLLQPTSGTIEYFGNNLQVHRSEILKKVGFASSFVRLPNQLSLEDNLYLFAKLYGLSSAEQKDNVRDCLQYFNLWSIRKRKAGALSSGQSARLMLAKAFVTKPSIILLDEPTAALDPGSSQDVRNFVLEQNERNGVSFLFTSHNMAEVTQICDRVLVLKDGEIIANNTPEELAQSVSLATIQLFISHNLDDLVVFCLQHDIDYTMNGNEIACQVHEQKIAFFLQEIGKRGIEYSQISIRTPQLEDYFLQIDRGER